MSKQRDESDTGHGTTTDRNLPARPGVADEFIERGIEPELTFRERLCDIEACLRSRAEKLYHMETRGQMSRNTLTNAKAPCDWRVHAHFAQRLIGMARML